MVIKVCLSIICYDRNIDRSIATYTDHNKIMSYWGFEEHVSCWKFQNFVFICCIKMLIKFIYIWGVDFANFCYDHICLTDICSDLLFCPSKMTITTKTNLLLFRNGNVYQNNFILLLKLAGCFI